MDFVRESIRDLESRGHEVELAGIFYHVGENDMSWGPARKNSAERVRQLISQSRIDLDLPNLVWYVSQQPPTDDKSVNGIDATANLSSALKPDNDAVHIQAFDMPPQEKKLVIDTRGIVWLGRTIANHYRDGHDN